MNAEEIYKQIAQRVKKFNLWDDFLEEKIQEWIIGTPKLHIEIKINNPKILNIKDKNELDEFELFLDYFCISKNTPNFVIKAENVVIENSYSFSLHIYPVTALTKKRFF